MEKEALMERVEVMEAERDKFIEEVNSRVSFYNGKIEMLKILINEMELLSDGGEEE